MNIAPMKKNMFSVMSNTGFGSMKYKAGNGDLFILPQKAIRKKDGVIKASWMKRLKAATLESCQWMFERGAIATHEA